MSNPTTSPRPKGRGFLRTEKLVSLAANSLQEEITMVLTQGTQSRLIGEASELVCLRIAA